MRFLTPVLILTMASISACKDDAVTHDGLGKFEVTIDGKATEIISHGLPSGQTHGRSGVMVVNSAGQNILIIEGAADSQDDGQPVFPLLSVTMISDATGGNFTLENVRYTLENGGNSFASDHNTGHQALKNLVLKDGKIGFDFSVDLVAHAPNSAGKTVLHGVAPIHIEGSFTGEKSLTGIND